MKKPIIAALLSLLVFPGAGHVWLKKTALGLGIILLSLAALSVSVYEIFKVVMIVLNDINLGKIDIEPSQLTATIMSTLENRDNYLVDTSLTILTICWISSALDAFRIGLKKSSNN